MYAFQLGREYKLSLAEIFAVFPDGKILFHDSHIALVDIPQNINLLHTLKNVGGLIKCIQIQEDYSGDMIQEIISDARNSDGKFSFGLSYFGEKTFLKKVLMDIKNAMKREKISARFVNKNFENLSSAQIIAEKLCQKGRDYTFFSIGKYEYFGRTIWIQDIDSYSKRDFGKTRDMQVGMLPPKLAQIMLNIAGTKKVYDPFCGLGTILIESLLSGNKEVYGSDISDENVKKTQENIIFTKNTFDVKIQNFETCVLDARGISSSSLLKKSDSIVSEGYLGQIFQKYSVTEKKISEEKNNLLDIYSHFFLGLKKANYKGNIVISFPFWEIHKKYFYFTEIYDILEKYCIILPLLPKNIEAKSSKSGSLLYKRPDQIVGREIFKLKIK